MSKFYIKFILISWMFLLSNNKSEGQTCFICYGGSDDGYANNVVSTCSFPATIFTGGIYTGFASGLNGTCSAAATIFTAGGSFGGSSDAADGICASPVSVATGGEYDGYANASVSPCSPPVTIVTGGDYDGIADVTVSPCDPPTTVLTGGSYDGISLDVVSICAPPASLMVGGEYDGSNGAFVYCDGVLSDMNQEGAASFLVNIYPNPSSGHFNVSFGASVPKAGSIIISDVLGKEIANENIVPLKQLYSFNTVKWAEGVYVLKIAADGKQLSRQVLVIKCTN